MSNDSPNRTAPDRADQTRTRILEAAVRQFARSGLAGARTEQIAEEAGVNKALIYYYFESKERLYSIALDAVSAKIRDRSMALFLSEGSPGERILRTSLDHFDRILSQHEFQSFVQQEMMRMHKGEQGELPALVKRIFAPVHTMYQAMVREGIASGELVEVDSLQVQLTSLGANVMFFLSSPVWRLLLDFDAYTPEAIAARRKASVEFLGQALFTDRKHGAELAAKVLSDTPMPKLDGSRALFGVGHECKK